MSQATLSQTATNWWRGAVIYQVYPRSFQDSNGDGIGDLPGVTPRMDHIANLGAQAVWLSPFFTSPMLDFGYDVSNYCDVDPIFGTLADFDQLVAKAHSLGLKVLIDLVLSHTSDQHPWFKDSRSSHDNAHADWYVWAEAKEDGTPPNNWLSIFGGSAWQWDTRRQQYYMHNFLTSQPDLNFHCPAVQDALLDVAKFWLDRGVDGFRLDTVNFYVHDQQLRNNPPMPRSTISNTAPMVNPYTRQQHVYDKTQPENLLFLQRLRALTDQYDDITTIGEIGDDHQYETLASYTEGNNRLHMAYVFALLTDMCKPTYLHGVLAEYLRDAGNAYVCWSLGNHDVPRLVSRWAALGGDERQRAHLLAAFLLSLPGAVCIYEGEELGLTDVDVPFELLQDPYGITMWPEFKGRDGCRTPMPWDHSANLGFTTGKPWLPLGEDHTHRVASDQQADAQSVLNDYRRFIAWRKTQGALCQGNLTLLPAHEQVLAFVRQAGDERLLCALNLSDKPASYALPAGVQATDLIGHGFTGQISNGQIELAPLQACFASVPANASLQGQTA
ncbi:alpha-glucosidase family protein [Silvimonas soli]|uniref:alpha-glucosidase family protein n=1 Tax=Silvimonas soli TaxID=2980100 RepID=UPI0024B38AAE|nr:alpha-glucosidase family protein [Silvimonas soli]